MKHSVRFEIFGREFSLRTELPPDEALKIAEFVNRRIDDVAAASRGADSLQVVMLAFLTLAAETLGKGGRENEVRREAFMRIDSLLEQAEEKLGDLQPGLDFGQERRGAD